ncbi:ArsR/SmtB family transcription factor [Micromonospora sp. NBC_01813]|uniref:ArsR/SmtB family transcription factor n=1 Tax=Micromonospora sp. NBC_01813 TaxID=2975988 RepID=UPI002DD807D6|nr:helix-turn-helix domain-containing protein [Micromonospora sp. NBC_01813]WSA09408.1 helix-turn-helix domain-containing protein [Micromonospora sp. NBC_01813]
MVVDQLDGTDADRVFHALADATRRDIVLRVMHTELSVSALARCYPMSFAAVQKHVAVLTRAALVTKSRKGREQLVRADVTTLRRAARLLDAYERIWHERTTRIEDLLAEDDMEGERRQWLSSAHTRTPKRSH